MSSNSTNNKVLFLICFSLLGCSPRKRKEAILPVEQNIQLDKSILDISVVAKGLNVPWEITWGPDDKIWMTEQHGEISKIDPETGDKKRILEIKEVWKDRTTGLLGMVIHPNIKEYPYVFVDYTIKNDKNIFSKLVRYTIQRDSLISPKTLLVIPGSSGHNGSRLAISPNGKLLWATGDAQKFQNAQNEKSLNGKILRLNIDGTVPENNPVKGSYVWAKGFRNMQGLTFSKNGLLYTSEHGDALEDEVNLITREGNYGWPNIEGVHDTEDEKKYAEKYNTIEPLLSWTPTIAPSGLTYYGSDNIPEWKNSLLLATLKARSLRVLKLNDDGTKILSDNIFLENEYGRLRGVCVSPKGDIYVSTSNKDWNPYSKPLESDDRILKISRANKISSAKVLKGKVASENTNIDNIDQLYSIYCGSCHKDDGSGVEGSFPALKGSSIVLGDKGNLIKVFLKGKKTENKPEQMPAFKFLSDEEGAAILTYIRTNWGNSAGAIQASEIKKMR
ncbi:PQQ-dependent sugar dehydrogenase [Pseudopedobacter saltans]|uniref:PQQ-dependent sugar dehydrogenase n=1 Tax=Pseudopedobacter saltans TaxID=151895 RepID=UPI0011D290C9|nr:PQQ-dependent sugar dehydrogenase [Pseudopedobacter saltans]